MSIVLLVAQRFARRAEDLEVPGSSPCQSCSRYQFKSTGENKAASKSNFKKSTTCGVSNTLHFCPHINRSNIHCLILRAMVQWMRIAAWSHICYWTSCKPVSAVEVELAGRRAGIHYQSDPGLVVDDVQVVDDLVDVGQDGVPVIARGDGRTNGEGTVDDEDDVTPNRGTHRRFWNGWKQRSYACISTSKPSSPRWNWYTCLTEARRLSPPLNLLAQT